MSVFKSFGAEDDLPDDCLKNTNLFALMGAYMPSGVSLSNDPLMH